MSLCLSLSRKDKTGCIKDLEALIRQNTETTKFIVEVRLDLLAVQGYGTLTAADLKEVFAFIKEQKIRCILTCRELNRDEGFSDFRKKLLTKYIAYADYIDVEIEAPSQYLASIKKLIEAFECKLIVSYHNYKNTPNISELKAIVDNSFKLGADVGKLATTSSGYKDNANLLSLYSYCLERYPNKKLIVLGMGEEGKITRITATFLGSPITFVAASSENCTAPGQLTAKDMQTVFRFA